MNDIGELFGYVFLAFGLILVLFSLSAIASPGTNPPGASAVMFVPGFVFMGLGVFVWNRV